MPYQKSGIPLPDNPDVAELRCIALYIPDDDIYLQALGGQVTELAKWTSWEKRGDDSAAIAASRWKDANDKTWAELWTKGLIMTCENVQDLIDTIAGINTTMISNNQALVNAINGLQLTLAPYDCIPCEDRVYTNPVPNPDPDPNNPPVGGDPAGWADYLCRSMNYMWDEHITRGGAQMILALTTGGGILSVAAASQILYATGIGAPLAFIGTIIIAVGAIAYIYDETTFEAALDDLKAGAICAVVNSTGAETAVTNLRNYLVAQNADQELIDYIMSVTGNNAMNKLFDGSIDVPANYVASFDCSDCGSYQVIEIVPGYFLIPVTEAYQINPVNTGAAVKISGNLWEITGNANGGVELWPELDPWGYDWDVNNGTARQGAMLTVDTISNTLWGIQSSTQVFHGSLQNLVLNEDIRCGNPGDLTDWLFEADRTTNMNGLTKPFFRILQYGGSSGQSCRVRLWVVMDQNGQI